MRTRSAFDYEATVETNQHLDPFVGEEVVTDADERTDEITAAQQLRQPCRVQHDIAVVGHEERTVLDVLLDLFAVAKIVQLDALRRPLPPDPQHRKSKQEIADGQQPSYAIRPNVLKISLVHKSSIINHQS